MCHEICDTSDLFQKLDSSRDRNILVDANIDDVHVSFSCYEIQNNDLGDIYEGETHIVDDDSSDIYEDTLHNDDDEIGCFEMHTKGIG